MRPERAHCACNAVPFNRMRFTLAAGLMLLASATAWAAEPGELYVKAGSWQEAMLASRERYLAWRAERARAPMPALGPWYSTGPHKAISFPTAVFPEQGVDLGAKDTTGGALWNARAGWADGEVHILPSVDNAATYLYRTITVEEPRKLTVYLGSDDALVVWLNGKQVLSKDVQRPPEPDQEQVVLDLAAGENALLMKVYNYGGGHGFYFSTRSSGSTDRDRVWQAIEGDFPVELDWMLQDAARPERDYPNWFDHASDTELERAMIGRVLDELGATGGELRARLDGLVESNAAPTDRRWLDLYVAACERRRASRLKPLLDKSPRIIFTKHYNMGGSHYAYTEGQSDANNEQHFEPGSSLCLLEIHGLYGTVRTLLDDRGGVIRDPDVSGDGARVLFAWKRSLREDDYHLYELDVETGAKRQLTFGLGFADYEGAYLPNGDIVFNSTRPVQMVDCWFTEVSNLYTCDKDGRFIRRLGYDQVHTNYPTVTDDGRVLYTRWEYSDRGQLFPQPLFQMNPDGTKQTEFYGNNSWFPTTIMHARGIPGSQKVLAVLSGHHSRQFGKLAFVDPTKGREENAGVQLIAPLRETRAERIDGYGQWGELFQYPYPLSETEFIVAYDPLGYDKEPIRTGIYFFTADGRRELLAADPQISCNQPVPFRARPQPHVRPALANYTKDTGTYYVQDVYEGPGLKDVARGTIKRLRVVALEYRATAVGANNNNGPAGGAIVCTPVAPGNGAWDVKVVLGEAMVYDDGSACFTVPARTPLYFQLLDAKGYAVQSMRSWSTLQPGESFSCIGCHEPKSMAPPARKAMTQAMKAGPQALVPFGTGPDGAPRGFSFPEQVQPILDQHCTRCHDDRSRRLMPRGVVHVGEDGQAATDGHAFSLLGDPNPDDSGRAWSDAYLALTQAEFRDGHYQINPAEGLVRWISAQSVPPMLLPYHAGAATSPLMAMLEKGHSHVELSKEELATIACWIDLLVPFCGDYTEANAWGDNDKKKYQHFLDKRRDWEAIERANIEALIESLKAPRTPIPDKHAHEETVH